MGSQEGQKEATGKGSAVRYATGEMVSKEVQNKDEGMWSEEVRYKTGDMMSGEDQNEEKMYGVRGKKVCNMRYNVRRDTE